MQPSNAISRILYMYLQFLLRPSQDYMQLEEMMELDPDRAFFIQGLPLNRRFLTTVSTIARICWGTWRSYWLPCWGPITQDQTQKQANNWFMGFSYHSIGLVLVSCQPLASWLVQQEIYVLVDTPLFTPYGARREPFFPIWCNIWLHSTVSPTPLRRAILCSCG